MDSFENGEGGGVAYSNLKKVLLKRQLLLSSLSVSPSPVCSLSLPPSPPITLKLQQNALFLENFPSVHLNSSYRVFFLTVPPNFSAKNINVVQPMRIFCTSKILWNGISDWLPIVFHFGTENWEEH